MFLTEKIREAVETCLASFEKGDLDAIMNLYADDCWIEDPVGSERKVVSTPAYFGPTNQSLEA